MLLGPCKIENAELCLVSPGLLDVGPGLQEELHVRDGVVRTVDPGRQVYGVFTRDVHTVDLQAAADELLHDLHLGGPGGLVQGRVLLAAPAVEVAALLQDDDHHLQAWVYILTRNTYSA